MPSFCEINIPTKEIIIGTSIGCVFSDVTEIANPYEIQYVWGSVKLKPSLV